MIVTSEDISSQMVFNVTINKKYYSNVQISLQEKIMLINAPSISFKILLSCILDHFKEEGKSDLHIISMIYKNPKSLEPFFLVVHKPEDLAIKLPQITAKKYLIFTNPHSGKKLARKILKKLQKNLFNSIRSHTFKYLETQYPNHLQEMLKKEDLDQYDYVILNSGDGLIHEAINECPHKKIGYLAGGTSNCILYNMLLENDFDYTDYNAAYMMLRGNTKGVRCMEIEGLKETLVKAVVFFSWGVIGECDLKSEKLRFLGELRYDLYGAYSWLAYKRAHGKITFQFENGSEQEVDSKFCHLMLYNMEFISQSIRGGDFNSESDLVPLQYVAGEKKKWSFMKFLLNLDRKSSHLKNNFVQKLEVKSFTLEPKSDLFYFDVDGEKYPLTQKITITKSKSQVDLIY